MDQPLQPPELSVTTEGPGGALGLASRTSKRGTRYHALTWHKSGSPREAIVPAWTNEVPWLLNSVDALARQAEFNSAQAEGTYPALANITASGGAAWDFEVKGDTRHLVFRRFNNSISRQGSNFFTRYFVPAKMGRFPQKLMIPEGFIRGGALGEFATEARRQQTEIEDFLRATLRPVPSDDFDPMRQAVLDGQLADYTTQSLADAIPLVYPIPRACLELCDEERSALQLSELLPLSAKEIGHALDWTRRYSDGVIADAFLFSPRSERSAETFLAQRQRDLFRSDPLLTCLDRDAELAESDDQDEGWIDAPQCGGASFEKALQLGRADGFYSTTWGRAPFPEEEEADKNRSFVRLHTSMRKHRYKILQLAWRASAEVHNLPGGIGGDPVLCFQRLALLRNDVANFFEEHETAGVLRVIRERMDTALAGNRAPTATDEWEELPRKEDR
jgi:hypothetical protein